MQQFAFDLDSPQLARQYTRASALLFRAGQRLVQQLALSPGKRVLDVGCGTGLLGEYVARIVGSSGLLVGIDPLPLRIEIASRKASTHLQFRVGTADDLSEFASHSFDAAYLHAVLHWLPDPLSALRQLRRVLKPGGLVGMSTVAMEGENTFNSVWRQVLSRSPYCDYPVAREVLNNGFRRDQIDSLLTRAGFAVRNIEVQPTVVEWDNADEAIGFVETISAGNLLGHLPDDLRAPAQEELATGLNRLRESGGIRLHGMRLVAVGERGGNATND